MPSQTWSPQPWLADLSQAQQAFKTKYANIDWLEHDREITLSTLFDRAASRIRSATSDTEAKGIFDRLIQRVGDGHVTIDWPRPASPSPAPASPEPSNICDDMGFDANRSTSGIGSHLLGYRQVGEDSPFPAGIIPFGKQNVGVIRIGVFEPEGSPFICHAALQALHIPADKSCDDKCQDAVLTWSYNRFTATLEEQVRALKAAGATALLVDVTDNGGGSEWAEAAARILSSRAILSARRGFVRGSHWSAQWKSLAEQLRRAAAGADPNDRSRLLFWAAEAEAARRDAEQACAGLGACPLVGHAGYATGLVGAARAGEFAGKPWADLVFSITQFPYHDAVWSGPLAVLVDDETWSAAEEFAAVLQDNRAAVIVGSRTGGAGCGHTRGGTPTVLENSGATLELPDCVRFRADGSDEVAGVIPDVLVGMRASDGATFKAKLIQTHLPAAIKLAIEQNSARRP
ncbi:S41 family peptidase [Sphingomonas oleivorans]|uniref:S41 family peptidase n=1 Tax=Sphingomonas oleivorans TaxID=1735121 RepID=UPI0013FD943E|nr:S41 family peptidase [Sphingomonas oleivorans]